MRRGPMGECLADYLASGSATATFAPGDADRPRIVFAELDRDALAQSRLVIRVGFRSPSPLRRPVLGIILADRMGRPIAGSNGRMQGETWSPPALKEGVITAEINPLPLHSDTYRASLFLGDAAEDYDEKRDALEFDFVSPNFYPESPRLDVIGPVDLAWCWSIESGLPVKPPVSP